MCHDERQKDADAQKPNQNKVRNSSPIIPRAAFGRMLDQLGQCNASSNAPSWRVRQLCGQWLAFRRLQKRLTDTAVANLLGINTEKLFLLELGFANAKDISDNNLNRLSELLADNPSDIEWITTVSFIAVGQSSLSEARIIDRVKQEMVVFFDVTTLCQQDNHSQEEKL